RMLPIVARPGRWPRLLPLGPETELWPRRWGCEPRRYRVSRVDAAAHGPQVRGASHRMRPEKNARDPATQGRGQIKGAGRLPELRRMAAWCDLGVRAPDGAVRSAAARVEAGATDGPLQHGLLPANSPEVL